MTDSRRHPDRHMARDVARHLDRRRMRRRVLGWLVLLGLIILAIVYLRCGQGLGIGGKGKGESFGPGSAPRSLLAADAGPPRCAIRVTATGISVDGKPATTAQAVTTCKPTGGAEVLITGDARQGDWDELRAALDAAGIPYLTREPRGATPPESRP